MWRPPRSYHCRICKRCIRKMDHHCPWVNNCVGEWNQKYFVLFVFYALLTCVIAGGIIGCVWKRVWELDSLDHTPHVVSVLIQASLFGLFTAMILWDQVASILSDEVSYKWGRVFVTLKVFNPTNSLAKFFRVEIFKV